MAYWLNLFSGPTWDEFQAAGSTVTGFRETQTAARSKIRSGDVFLCYLTGVSRWVGALEVVGTSADTTRIWKDAEFPVRFEVRPLIVLTPDHGIPMEELEGLVSFKWRGLVRRSPNHISQVDGDAILQYLRVAEASPVERPVDPRKLARKPFYRTERQRGRTKVATVVSVPEPEPESRPADDQVLDTAPAIAEQETAYIVSATRHIEMQYDLLWLGAEMGLDVWVARNDRTRIWQGHVLGTMPRTVFELPVQFNEATQRTIELIDVLWLKGNSIVAAFEIESTTSIYSGLLRMSDLLALQPNLDIDLYLVAPDERADKVQQEILRPTFAVRERPLPEICGYLQFSKLQELVEMVGRLDLASSLKADFLRNKAIFFSAGRAHAKAAEASR